MSTLAILGPRSPADGFFNPTSSFAASKNSELTFTSSDGEGEDDEDEDEAEEEEEEQVLRM